MVTIGFFESRGAQTAQQLLLMSRCMRTIDADGLANEAGSPISAIPSPLLPSQRKSGEPAGSARWCDREQRE
jgi:hypothetical protein